jgi:hypothetical protein
VHLQLICPQCPPCPACMHTLLRLREAIVVVSRISLFKSVLLCCSHDWVSWW